MKQKQFSMIVSAILLTVLMTLFASQTVFAEDIPEPYDPEIVETEPVQTEEPVYTEPVYTEPVYTDEPVYTEEPIYTEEPPEYTEPVTEPQPEETQAPTEYAAPIENDNNNSGNIAPTEFFEPPTLPKTVSQKTYSTNYTAGIVSWICVGVGIIVMAVVLISNKISGRRRMGGI